MCSRRPMQFCFKAAEAICKMEGYKFWFCSDYDTDIIWVIFYYYYLTLLIKNRNLIVYNLYKFVIYK